MYKSKKNIEYTSENSLPVRNGGFTIIEMVVATGLFVTVVLISIGALLTATVINARVQSSRNVSDNLNLAIENIARNMRTGIDYHCGDDNNPGGPWGGNPTALRDCATGGGSFISFTNDRGLRVAFRLSGTTIESSFNCGPTGCDSWLGVTAPEIKVTRLTFYVAGTSGGDEAQPIVFVILQGEAGLKTKEQVLFNVQTTVSQRIFDS